MSQKVNHEGLNRKRLTEERERENLDWVHAAIRAARRFHPIYSKKRKIKRCTGPKESVEEFLARGGEITKVVLPPLIPYKG